MIGKIYKIHCVGKYGGAIAKCGKVVDLIHITNKIIFIKLKDKFKCKRCAK